MDRGTSIKMPRINQVNLTEKATIVEELWAMQLQ
jgi:hypothetical protein